MSRKCVVKRKQFIMSEPGTSGGKAYWQELGACEATFHQFVTEASEDNQLITMAIIEYATGVVEAVPLSWLKLEPIKAEDKLDYVLTNFVDDLTYRLRETLHECSSWFSR